MDEMSPGSEYNAESIHTDMPEDIFDRSQSHLSINRRDVLYNIRDYIKQRQDEKKGALLSTRNMGKVLHKVFKSIVNELSESSPIMGEQGSEVS